MRKPTIVRPVSVDQLETAVSNVFGAIRRLIANRQQELLRASRERSQSTAPDETAPYLEELPLVCCLRLLELSELAEQISQLGYLEFGQHFELMMLFRTKSESPTIPEEAT